MIVKHLPRSSAVVRQILGDNHEWDLANHLRAMQADALRVANWQRAGGKEKDRPKPIPRPGVEQPKQYGSSAVSMDEMRDRLERRRQTAT